MARIRAVLLDVDGTLLDSNEDAACARVARWPAGPRKNVPFEVAVRSRIGMGPEKGILPSSSTWTRAGWKRTSGSSRRRSAVFGAHYLADLGPLSWRSPSLLDRIRSREALLRCG